jgi:Pyoverdine/dityrosine biosynthesis protein
MQPVVSNSVPLAPWLDGVPTPDLATLSQFWTVESETSPLREAADKLLTLLTSSAVRKGSLAEMQLERCVADLARSIQRCVRADRPVQLTLMAFPFKVPNPAKVGSRQMPDLAELAALVRLYRLNSKVKSIYPPGLEIHIIHDGSFIADLFGVRLEEVRSYERYFARLVRALGANTFLRQHDFQDLVDAGNCDPGRQASPPCEAALEWRRSPPGWPEWTDWFRKTLGMINLRGLPRDEVCRLLDHASGGHLSSEYRDLERSVNAAMLRYYERDSWLHACDPRSVCFPDAIHVTTQCRPRRLAIWLVNRGQSLLPWHGVGVIDRSGKWKVALARTVLQDRSYKPVCLEGEDTPFFYREVD